MPHILPHAFSPAYILADTSKTQKHTGRWGAMCGAKGRWKRNLIGRCVREGKAYDDISCSPVVRQTLQHWAYRLTEADYLDYKTQIAAGAKTAFIPASTMPAQASDSAVLSQDATVSGNSGVCQATKQKGKQSKTKPSGKEAATRKLKDAAKTSNASGNAGPGTRKRPRQ